MVKKRDWRLVSRSIFGPIILLLLVAGAYAAVIYGFSHFEYDSEWRSEQENFETLAANAVFEKQRLAASAESAQTYTSKYSLGTNDVYGIISGFLNKTMLTVETYTFKWTKSLSFKRMYDHAFQLSDDSDLKFYKPSTKIIDIIFRSILPIFTTFAVGASVSAIHSIVTNVLQICIRHKKHEAWTVGRNRMLRVNVVAAMVVAIVYFVVCFFLITLACTRWQDVSYADGVKITINLIATLPPKVKQTSIIDAHTLAALSFVIHSGTAYVIFTLINLMKTWRISEFSIPLIKDIDQADQVDKNMQVQYKMKRAEVLQKNAVENLEQKKISDGLDPIVEAINVTDRFFRSPEEYKEYADKCEAIINCGTELDATKVPLLLQKISPCLFYMFYNREFSTCAHKLIAKKDDKIPCLNTLFNDIHEPEVDECVQWDGLQPCIKEQIGKECDDAMLKEYEKQEKNLRPELCD